MPEKLSQFAHKLRFQEKEVVDGSLFVDGSGGSGWGVVWLSFPDGEERQKSARKNAWMPKISALLVSYLRNRIHRIWWDTRQQ